MDTCNGMGPALGRTWTTPVIWGQSPLWLEIWFETKTWKSVLLVRILVSDLHWLLPTHVKPPKTNPKNSKNPQLWTNRIDQHASPLWSIHRHQHHLQHFQQGFNFSRIVFYRDRSYNDIKPQRRIVHEAQSSCPILRRRTRLLWHIYSPETQHVFVQLRTRFSTFRFDFELLSGIPKDITKLCWT